MTVTHAHDALTEAFQYAIDEFTALIARRFAAHRVIRLEVCPDGRWCAMLYVGETGQLVFPPCPDLRVVYRFVRAFARKENVAADVSLVEDRDEHSVRVPPKLTVVQ